MHHQKVLVIGGALAIFVSIVTAQALRLTPDQVGAHVGETATVCGTVTVGHCLPARNARLDFKTSIGGETVSIGVSTAARQGFGERFESRYMGADVCATGPIVRMAGDVMVMVSAPDRLLVERASSEPASTDAFTNCDEGVVVPRAVHRVSVRYTAEALRAHVRGEVWLQGIVDRDGTVRDVQVTQSLDPGLDTEAVKAFRQWQFEPGSKGGAAVPVLVEVQMTFTMR